MEDKGRRSFEEDYFFIPIKIDMESYFHIHSIPCQKCGARNWIACNVDEDGNLFECSECTTDVEKKFLN